MAARIGSKERLAEVRAAERSQHPAESRGAWRIINRTTADFAAEGAFKAYPDRLRGLDPDGLRHEGERLDGLPTTPLVAEMRAEVELEQAGRRWQCIVREAERDGWETVILRQRRTAVGVS